MSRASAMGLDARLFDKLRRSLDEERCRTCDCLQGALAQMELDGGEGMAARVEPHKVGRDRMHHCLGCDPCPPAEALSDYIRELRSDEP
ncbi:MAG: hypothetical protein ACYTFI_09730 [Planctomycetota bacterium]|jgi:hypothetical protein